jgi:hypothetical protein
VLGGLVVAHGDAGPVLGRRVAEGPGEGGGVGQVGCVDLQHGAGGQVDALVGVLGDAAHRDEAAYRR